MNKTTFEKAINGRDGNYIIFTDIAVGRGINGVAYRTYNENKRVNGFSQASKVLEVTDDDVVLEIHNYEGCYPIGTFEVYIPLENIVEVYINS